MTRRRRTLLSLLEGFAISNLILMIGAIMFAYLFKQSIEPLIILMMLLLFLLNTETYRKQKAKRRVMYGEV